MATDFMLLQRYPESGYPRFRAYAWHQPAFTFGYSQKIDFVRAQLPTDEPVDVCRRPTGGGIVDHRNDWTYALVIPRGHPAEATRALESYRLVHRALADALGEQGQPAELKQRGDEKADAENASSKNPGLCFQRAECFDVIATVTQRKIAGAAQKRNKHGLLFQGSIDRGAVRVDFDWETFHDTLVRHLAKALDANPQNVGWPDWSDDELNALVETYSTAEWNAFR